MRLTITLVLFAFSSLAWGCKENVAANVNCAVAADTSLDCTVSQTQGKSEIEVCWEVSMTCENGATLKSEKSCAKAKDGQSTTAKVPADKVTITGNCDKVKTSEVVNMSIKGT